MKSGKEFARALPDRARMFNIDRIDERDPLAEHLLTDPRTTRLVAETTEK